MGRRPGSVAEEWARAQVWAWRQALGLESRPAKRLAMVSATARPGPRQPAEPPPGPSRRGFWGKRGSRGEINTHPGVAFSRSRSDPGGACAIRSAVPERRDFPGNSIGFARLTDD